MDQDLSRMLESDENENKSMIRPCLKFEVSPLHSLPAFDFPWTSTFGGIYLFPIYYWYRMAVNDEVRRALPEDACVIPHSIETLQLVGQRFQLVSEGECGRRWNLIFRKCEDKAVGHDNRSAG